MPDCVYTSMYPMDPARPGAPGHRLSAEGEPAELADRNHPVLASGEVGDQPVDVGFMNVCQPGVD